MALEELSVLVNLSERQIHVSSRRDPQSWNTPYLVLMQCGSGNDDIGTPQFSNPLEPQGSSVPQKQVTVWILCNWHDCMGHDRE